MSGAKRGSEPVTLPRWVLGMKYALFAVLGVAVSVATSPSLAEVTSEWYTAVWGLGVTAAAIVAFYGSTRASRWAWEAAGGAGVVSLMVVYAVSPIILIVQGDTDRLAYSIIAVAFTVTPAGRLWQLIRGGANA